MNKIYLVDGENIAPKMLEGFVKKKKLSGKDQIHILYTKNSGNDYKNHKVFTKKKKNTIYLEVDDGKNALDFQLSTYLGYILGVAPYEKAYIIANDKGYEATVSFCKTLGRYVKIITLDSPKEEKKEKDAKITINKKANKRSEEEWALVAKEYKKAKHKKKVLYAYATSLNDLYLNCIHLLGQKEGVAYYRDHKSEFRAHFKVI